ncbi:hypothetical protein EKK58_05020 [Candidatus Dependentiae bacterium]|nr:MAG: hypothetical protein EKK58_05020 [Candidatus Dependentiae bacterium]
MKIIYTILLGFCLTISNRVWPQAYQVDFYQMISGAKEQIKWDCARLAYLLVQDALSKIEKPLNIPLYDLVGWIFDSDLMKEVHQMTSLMCSKAEIYAIAASIARENKDEDAWLVLQIAAGYAQKGWFSRHATLLTYTFGILCGYVGSYYIKLNKDIFPHLKIS